MGCPASFSKILQTSDDIPLIANEMLMTYKILRKNEKYVITGGVPVGEPGTTNYLSVLKEFKTFLIL